MTNSLAASILVSVVLPAYNAEAYLTEAVDSILAQTYPHFELILIDDGSTDGTTGILSAYATHDNRIKLIRNEKPSGRAGDAAKEMGISLARGKYVAIMDADDIAKPNRLERQVAFMEANKDVFLCGSWADYIDRTGAKFHEWKPVTTHDQIVKHLALKNSIMHSTFFFRNIDSCKPFYETKYESYNDYYTQFKFIKQGKTLANVPEILLTYRVSGQSVTQTKAIETIKEYMDVREEIATFPSTKPSLLHRLIVLAQHLAVEYLPGNFVLSLHPVFKKSI